MRTAGGTRLGRVGVAEALRNLAFIRKDKILRPVDYKNLGSEELGSIYESLLELHPLVNAEAATFELTAVSGSERKTTGSYYTPASLIQVLLDSALEPVVAEALKPAGASIEDQESAIVNLKVVDPACGSGHFLVAAAHRLARRLASIRTGEGEPAPEAMRSALRAVISNCIYGVDINPMSVELCKVSLWMEALEPGKPLSFLDAHIQCGDSLVGVSPNLDISEIPDEAFNPAFGDDKATSSALKKRNKRERGGSCSGLSAFQR
jgi:type I restriction-modification system DNA methylase subunit